IVPPQEAMPIRPRRSLAHSTALAPEELDSLVLRVLQEAERALGVAQVRAALPPGLRPSVAELAMRLGELTEAARIHRWPGAKAPLFALAPLGEYLRARVISLLEVGPRSEGELRKAVGSQCARGLKELLPT